MVKEREEQGMVKERKEGGRRSVFRCVWCRGFRQEEGVKVVRGGWWIGRLREKEEAAPLWRGKSTERRREGFERISGGCGRKGPEARWRA